MRGFLGKSALGALDQALLSAVNLLIGLALIRWSDKSQYASYSLAFACVLLAQSAQAGLVNGPLATLYPGKVSDESRKVLGASASLMQFVVVGMVLIVGLAFCAVGIVGGGGPGFIQVVLATAVAAVGLLLREYTRAAFYLTNNALGALLSDIQYAFCVATLCGILVARFALTASGVLLCVGFAGLISGSLAMRRLRPGFGALKNGRREDIGDIWECARWSLPSVIVSWAYANGFLFVIDFYLGSNIVADVAASRLLMVPLSLMIIGWSTVFRPRAGHLFASGEIGEISRVIRISALSILALSALYGTAAIVGLHFFGALVLGPKYSGLESLAVLWLLFFAVTAVRMIGMTAMHAAKQSFKPLFQFGLIAFLVAVPATIASSRAGSPALVIAGLIVAESCLACLIWFRGWPSIAKLAPASRVAAK